MELQMTVTEIEMPKRKTSEAAKRAQAKWRQKHADAYREKCREYSRAYYDRHHDEILERMRQRSLKNKVIVPMRNVLSSGSEMSE